MIRVTQVYARHESLTPRDFHERFAAYARRVRENASLRRYVRAYVASATILTYIPGQPAHAYDALADFWFDDAAAYGAFAADDAVRAALRVPPQRLFGETHPDVVTVERTPLIDGGQTAPGIFNPQGVRVTTLLVRREDLATAEFLDYHRRTHAPLFASAPIVKRNVRRYVIAHRAGGDDVPVAAGAKRYDGVVDYWFDNLFDLVTTFVDPEYLATVRPDERRFVDLKSCDVVISRELGAGGVRATGTGGR